MTSERNASERRRASDHPYEAYARFGLALAFGGAAIWFAHIHNDLAMGTFLVACGAMAKVPLGKVLPR